VFVHRNAISNYRWLSSCGRASLLVLVLVAANICPAATILYEPFDYSVGGLNGQNGGIGFSESWYASTSSAAVAAPGLAVLPGEHAPQSLRHRDHPLPHRHRRNDMIDKGGSSLIRGR